MEYDAGNESGILRCDHRQAIAPRAFIGVISFAQVMHKRCKAGIGRKVALDKKCSETGMRDGDQGCSHVVGLAVWLGIECLEDIMGALGLGGRNWKQDGENDGACQLPEDGHSIQEAEDPRAEHVQQGLAYQNGCATHPHIYVGELCRFVRKRIFHSGK